MLDVTRRLVVIIGGGSVAVRKAKGLIAAGAKQVRCVALVFEPEMPGEVERVQAEFEPAHLEGAELVFAATDSPQVNERVVREARERGVLANRADVDEEDPCDFTTPAIWRAGAVMVTVSAGGSAALAAAIRDDLADKINPLHVRMAELMRRLRPMIVQSRLSESRRREVLRELAADEAMQVLSEGGETGLLAWLMKRWPAIGER